jgi:hypothetical protein
MMDINSMFEACTDEGLSAGEEQYCYVVRRGGGQVIAELSPLEGSFCERRLDEKSLAVIVAEATDDKCRSEMNDIYIGMDLEWYRDQELIWAGPIIGITWGVDQIKIQAADLTAWWELRTLPTVKFNDREASEVVKEIHRLAMIEDPIAGFYLQIKPTSDVVTQEVFDEENRTAADVINELAEYAIDYTAYGRTILVGPADFLPELPYTLTDNDWVQPPSIEARGPSVGFATRIIATAAGDYTYVATASESLIDLYGLIERTVDFPYITTPSELKRAAISYLDLYSQPYFVNFEESDPLLLAGAAIPFRSLIPGAVIMVESLATTKKLRMRMRIMTVKNDADGSVSVTLEPAGTTGSISV